MFLLFHVAIPLLVFEIPRVKSFLNFNRLALIIGALLPDLIDKPILLLSLGSGRGFSHSLLFVVILYLSVFLIMKRKTIIANSLAIGVLFHLLLDLPGVPLFAPFIQYNFEIIEDPIRYWINKLFTDPLIQSTEIFGLSSLLFILFQNKLFKFKKIFHYLIQNNIKSKALFV
jgi:membrane-bound metal-dependent hydrolase YbcI (DUF457 family)